MYEIKKLKWLKATVGDFFADGLGCHYSIILPITDAETVWLKIDQRNIKFKTENAAKVFAQTHFEKQVMKFLNVKKGSDDG